MATTWYIDQRAANQGGTNAGSQANPWWSIYDMAYSGSMAAGDTIVFVAGSGPYYEVDNESASYRMNATDISFNSGTKTITSTANSFASYVAGDIIRVMGSQSNDGQYTVASVAGAGPFTLTVNSTNNLVTESAGNRIRIVSVTPAAAARRPFVMNQARNGASSTPMLWTGNGVEISAGLNLMTSAYKWTQSTGKAGEWYCTRADGSNPSLIQPDSAVVNGNFMCANSGDATHARGTVGSLSFDGQYGFGNNDSLGFNTVYVKSTANPTTLGSTIQVGQVQFCMFQNWGDHVFTNFTFSFGNGLADSGTSGACIYGRGLRTKFRRCAFKFASGHGLEANASGPFTLDHCITYWCGHRGFYLSGNITLNVYNHIDAGSHLMGLVAVGVTSAGFLNVYGSTCYDNEAGAFDIKSTSVNFSEGWNCFYPRMTATNGKLGYLSTSVWAKTAPTDIPASTVTTTSSQSSLTDPKFVAYSATSYTSCDFHLNTDSLCAGRGPWALGDSFTDFAGNTYTAGAAGVARSLNIGCYQNLVTAGPNVTTRPIRA